MPFPSNQRQQVQPEEIPNVSITQRVSPRGPLNPPPPRFSRDRIRRTRSPPPPSPFLSLISFSSFFSSFLLFLPLLSILPFHSSPVFELEPTTVNRNGRELKRGVRAIRFVYNNIIPRARYIRIYESRIQSTTISVVFVHSWK